VVTLHLDPNYLRSILIKYF